MIFAHSTGLFNNNFPKKTLPFNTRNRAQTGLTMYPFFIMFTIDTIPFHTCKTLPLFNIYFDFHHWNHHKRTDIRIEKPWNSYYQVNDRLLPPIQNPGAYPLWCPRTHQVFRVHLGNNRWVQVREVRTCFPEIIKGDPFFPYGRRWRIFVFGRLLVQRILLWELSCVYIFCFVLYLFGWKMDPFEWTVWPRQDLWVDVNVARVQRSGLSSGVRIRCT